MLYFYYTTNYHPDCYMVGKIYIVFEGHEFLHSSYAFYDPEEVHKRCQNVIAVEEEEMWN